MPLALDVLVVDDRPESVRFLTEFLIQRCRRVDVSSSVREAVTAVTRRRAAGERYHLVFSDFAMPEADGLSLLRDLRSRQDDVPFVFVTGYRGLNPAFETDARRLGVLTILDKPINLQQIEEVLAKVARGLTESHRRTDAQDPADQPFFGTSRMYRRPATVEPPVAMPAQQPAVMDALEPRVARPVAPVAPVGPQRTAEPPPPPPPPAPAVPLAGYQRRPSGIIPMGTGTARLRRSVEPGAAPAQEGGTGRINRVHTPQPPTAFTTRTRRGVEGTAGFQNPNAARTEQGRMVACGNCRKQFLVVTKAEAFTTVCVHCGQLQRVEPS